MDAPRCKGCGKASLAPLEGADWSCTRCGLIQPHGRYAGMSLEQRRRCVERWRERVLGWRAAGKCHRCGGEPVEGHALCRKHTDYRAASKKRRREATNDRPPT